MDNKKLTVASIVVDFLLIAALVFNTLCLGQMATKLNKSNDRVAALEQQNEELKGEIGSMTDAIGVYESENTSLNDALEDMKDEVQEQKDVIDKLQQEETTEVVDTTSKNNTPSSYMSSSVSDVENKDNEMVFSATKNDGYTSEEVVINSPEDWLMYEALPNYYWELSDDDRYYLERMVETETYGADMMSKTHVASVALNRMDSGLWGDSMAAVITAPSQFAYGRTSISDSTKEAVDYVLENGDTAQGALYFHSGGYTSTFCGRSCIFGDDVGHYFY